MFDGETTLFGALPRYELYMKQVFDYMVEYPELRMGQALSNMLYIQHEDLFHEVVHTELDTYHTLDGDKINWFLDWMAEKLG